MKKITKRISATVTKDRKGNVSLILGFAGLLAWLILG